MSFPLPLTPFESLMFLDARNGYPMVFYIVIDLRGVVDRPRIERAFSLVRQRHPLMNALVQWTKNGLEWVPAKATPPSVNWSSMDNPSFPVADDELNLVDRPGLHLTVLEKGEQSQLLLRCHHSYCDGMGVFLFIDELLSAYHQLNSDGSGEVNLAPLNPDALPRRGEFLIYDPHAPQMGRWPAIWSYLSELRKFFLYFPSPVKSVRVPAGGTPFRSCSLSADVVARLRKVAAKAEVQVNDLLLCEAFRTLQAWNGFRGRWRITMPVAMRDDRHLGCPAANILSYTFLNRTNADCKNPEALLKSIAWETGMIKQYRLGEWFLLGLGMAMRYPRLVRWAARWNTCFASIVLSYVSDPSRRMMNTQRDETGRLIAGNLIVENMRAVPPVRPKTRLTLAITTYTGRLTITGMGCPKSLTGAAVQKFLDDFSRRLEELASEVAEPNVPAVTS